MPGQISGWSILGRSIFMTVVVTGRPICVVVVLFMVGLGVCLHMTQCLVVDGHSELIMVIIPARHLAYFGGRGTINMLGPLLYFSIHTM